MIILVTRLNFRYTNVFSHADHLFSDTSGITSTLLVERRERALDGFSFRTSFDEASTSAPENFLVQKIIAKYI